jgi:hypothetical protein
MEARMRATGGRLSFTERNRLNQKLSNLSFQVTRELNDLERRHVGYRNRGWNR